MHYLVKVVAHYTAMIAEAIAALFIIFGIIGAVVIYVRKTIFIHTDYQVMMKGRSQATSSQ